MTRVSSLYSFRNTGEIVRYLEQHPELVSFLHEAHPHLQMHFGSSSTYSLEVMHDPECQHQELMVYIGTSGSLDQALLKLDRFDEEWFLTQLPDFGQLVNFNIEHQ